MLFVKKFFVKRALASALKADRFVKIPNLEKPQSFQLVLDEMSDQEIENYINLLKTHFKVESVVVFVVYRRKAPLISADKQTLFFAPAFLSWMGKVKDELLKQQFEKTSHISLDLRKNHNLLGDFLLASLASNFRVNFGHDGAADLCLKLDKSADLATKFIQLKKYLIQLNGK